MCGRPERIHTRSRKRQDSVRVDADVYIAQDNHQRKVRNMVPKGCDSDELQDIQRLQSMTSTVALRVREQDVVTNWRELELELAQALDKKAFMGEVMTKLVVTGSCMNMRVEETGVENDLHEEEDLKNRAFESGVQSETDDIARVALDLVKPQEPGVFSDVSWCQALNDTCGTFVKPRLIVKWEDVRCRSAAQEFAKAVLGEDLFAVTTPLFSAHSLLSRDASERRGRGHGFMALDLTCALRSDPADGVHRVARQGIQERRRHHGRQA